MTFPAFLEQEIARAGGAEYLADRLEIATTTLYRYRLGQICPRADVIERLAKVSGGAREVQIVHMVYAAQKLQARRIRARKPLAPAPLRLPPCAPPGLQDAS